MVSEKGGKKNWILTRWLCSLTEILVVVLINNVKLLWSSPNLQDKAFLSLRKHNHVITYLHVLLNLSSQTLWMGEIWIPVTHVLSWIWSGFYILHFRASFSSASNIHLFHSETTKKNTPKWQPLLWKQKQTEQSPASPFLIQCLFLTIWPLFTDDTMLYPTALLRPEDLYHDKFYIFPLQTYPEDENGKVSQKWNSSNIQQN